jgi:hypothetical protein
LRRPRTRDAAPSDGGLRAAGRAIPENVRVTRLADRGVGDPVRYARRDEWFKALRSACTAVRDAHHDMTEMLGTIGGNAVGVRPEGISPAERGV